MDQVQSESYSILLIIKNMIIQLEMSRVVCLVFVVQEQKQ